MQALRRIVLGFTLAAAVVSSAGCAVAQPVPGPYGAGTPAPANVPADWQADLAPYGTWTDLPNYGTVWYPSVAPGWRPYLYGSWAWGPGGWTWYSTDPWGFTFHYGRWAWAPIGWVWVPGFTWGPAWVNWYWGSGFVGWAPLGFFSPVPFAQFVFVFDRDFNCDDVHKHWHNKPPHGGGGFHGPPPPSHIQQVAHDPIVRVSPSQLPNRGFSSRRIGTATPRPQSPGSSPGMGSAAPRGNGQNQGRPSGNRQQAALPPGQNPQSFAPRGQSGRDNPRPPASPSNAYRPPQARPPSASPPSYYATPRTLRPQGNGYGYGAYPGAPQSVPRGMQPGRQGMQPGQGVAPPSQAAPRMAPPASQGMGRMAPPASQGAPRMAPMAPSMQSAPRMAPMAPSMGNSMQSAPAAPSAPSGGGSMGGGRGSGGGGGFSPRGMR